MSEVVDRSSRNQRAYQHPDSVSQKRDDALRCASQMRRSFLIGVELPGHEKKVITETVKQDRQIEHPQTTKWIAIRQEYVAYRPREQTHDQDVLDAETSEDERHEQHHGDFGNLSKSHFSRGIFDMQFIEVGIRKRKIESQRNASQD